MTKKHQKYLPNRTRYKEMAAAVATAAATGEQKAK